MYTVVHIHYAEVHYMIHSLRNQTKKDYKYTVR